MDGDPQQFENIVRRNNTWVMLCCLLLLIFFILRTRRLLRLGFRNFIMFSAVSAKLCHLRLQYFYFGSSNDLNGIEFGFRFQFVGRYEILSCWGPWFLNHGWIIIACAELMLLFDVNPLFSHGNLRKAKFCFMNLECIDVFHFDVCFVYWWKLSWCSFFRYVSWSRLLCQLNSCYHCGCYVYFSFRM